VKSKILKYYIEKKIKQTYDCNILDDGIFCACTRISEQKVYLQKSKISQPEVPSGQIGSE
jgi:hypothetical protein